MRLFIIGNLKLKWLALIAVLLDVLLMPEGNEGGRFGHLGGAFFGFAYIQLMRKGIDLTVDFLRPYYWIRQKWFDRPKRIKVVHSKPKSDHEFNEEKANKQKQVDAILEKIKRSGYESLSKQEKEILFKASKEL